MNDCVQCLKFKTVPCSVIDDVLENDIQTVNAREIPFFNSSVKVPFLAPLFLLMVLSRQHRRRVEGAASLWGLRDLKSQGIILVRIGEVGLAIFFKGTIKSQYRPFSSTHILKPMLVFLHIYGQVLLMGFCCN